MDTDKGWLLPPERFPDGTPIEWADSIGRLAMKAIVLMYLKELLKMTKNTRILEKVLNAMLALENYYEVNERVIQRHEAKSEWDRFRLLHRRLAGAASEFCALAGRSPEGACGAFKAQQVNRILVQVREQIGEVAGSELPLVSEEGEQSYGDVSLLLRGWLDLCAEYAWQHYDGNPPNFPYDHTDYGERLIQERILAYCQNEAKSLLEIGEMLGYRSKKTIRRYLTPLLAAGRLARTVPDRPNSRNQKYITARMI